MGSVQNPALTSLKNFLTLERKNEDLLCFSCSVCHDDGGIGLWSRCFAATTTMDDEDSGVAGLQSNLFLMVPIAAYFYNSIVTEHGDVSSRSKKLIHSKTSK